MTWTKFGTEFADECVEANLSDAAFRTHVEGLMYAYGIEDMDLHLRRKLVPRFAGSEQVAEAITELVAKGFWTEQGDGWRIVHHEDVFRASVSAQVKHREGAKAHARKKRAAAGINVDANVDTKLASTGADVDANVDETQTDRQAFKQVTNSDVQVQPSDSSFEVVDPETGEVYDTTTEQPINIPSSLALQVAPSAKLAPTLIACSRHKVPGCTLRPCRGETGAVA